MAQKKVIIPGGVDEYIAQCPSEIQPKLAAIRAVIRDIAPDAIETVSYFQFPGYCYDEGYDYNGMFAWFSYKKPFVRLHVRPPVAADHASELEEGRTNKITTRLYLALPTLFKTSWPGYSDIKQQEQP